VFSLDFDLPVAETVLEELGGKQLESGPVGRRVAQNDGLQRVEVLSTELLQAHSIFFFDNDIAASRELQGTACHGLYSPLLG
jgi:hypothetical protein